MKFIFSDKYNVDLGNHVFVTFKCKRVCERLIAEGLATAENFIQPSYPNIEDLLSVHTKEYIDKIMNNKLSLADILRLELPFSEEVKQWGLFATSGTILACSYALEEKIAIHIGGGFHHAFAGHGEGFCLLNDIAVGIRVMQRKNKIKKALVIDCDLHQGNGTASIFKDDPDVFTFSIHEEDNYPIPKEQSDKDIGLNAGTSDDVYINYLKTSLPNIITSHKPELIIYVAGADPYYQDQLGRLNLTKDGLRKRDKYIFSLAKENNIPICVVYGGGYAINPEDTVDIHLNTIKEAMEIFK